MLPGMSDPFYIDVYLPCFGGMGMDRAVEPQVIFSSSC